MEPLKTSRILFLGEQDGEIERELKRELSGYFSSHVGVISAYLVRVSYKETPGVNVSLCVSAEASNRAELLPRMEEVFRRLFRTTQHMDILFLSQSQLSVINEVAKPFYTASTQQLSRINAQGDQCP
jgi:hypothetical protein